MEKKVNRKKVVSASVFCFLTVLTIALTVTTCSKKEIGPSAQTHIVTFHYNDERMSLANQPDIVFHGDPVPRPRDPKWPGHSFEGWYTDNGSFTNSYNLSAPITEDIQLYAKWTAMVMPEMAWVPGGSFRMGSNDKLDLYAKPVHTVSLDGFYMARNLITQSQYQAVTGFNPSYFSGLKNSITHERADLPEGLENPNNLPVEQVTWYDVAEFCNKLSVLEGLNPVYAVSKRVPPEGYPIIYADVIPDWNANGYRMPTEAEWEYAAKGGDGMGPYFIYSGSDDPEAVAWYSVNASNRIKARGDFDEFWEETYGGNQMVLTARHDVREEARTYEVGLKEPNQLGIYDLSGNVFEWCWDWFGEYPSAAQANPKGPPDGDNRVRRGGTFAHIDESIVRVARRDMDLPVYKFAMCGIRLVRSK